MESPNQKTTDTLNTQSANKASTGFGSQFKVARERKNISISDASSELNILKRHLEAIERNDFDSLPQAAFTRGFVSSYAKFLKLDVSNVLSHFDSIYPKSSPAMPTDMITPAKVDTSLGKVSRNDSRKTSFGRLGMLLAFFGLLGFGFLYMTSSKKSESTKVDTAAPTALEEMQQQDESTFSPTSTDGTVDENATANTDGANANNSDENKANSEADDNANATTDNAAATAQPAVVADPNAKPAELVLWVIRTTNINITDQTGTVIMSGDKRRGEHKVTGKPPFSIQIANAANVRLNMDKVPVKLKKYSVDNKANFTLNK